MLCHRQLRLENQPKCFVVKMLQRPLGKGDVENARLKILRKKSRVHTDEGRVAAEAFVGSDGLRYYNMIVDCC